VFGERFEHVVEKLDVGIDLDRSAVESQAQIDLRLFGRPLDDRAALAQLRAPLACALRPPIGSSVCTAGPV
jgi:hypothetical protein